ncbi:hypothetical protein BGW80DRAFT_1301560 [Lactifluus volemus]|nr:hypothetical protein BGW80DRAFT_1301560 [Lactifluus volemus]
MAQNCTQMQKRASPLLDSRIAFFFLFYVLAGTCHSKIKNISKLDGFFLIFFLARLDRAVHVHRGLHTFLRARPRDKGQACGV